MHPDHETLLKQLHAAARGAEASGFDLQSYLGAPIPVLNVSAPAQRKIVRDWRSAHKPLPTAMVLELVDMLVQGDFHEEKTLGLLILEGLGRGRRPFGPAEVDRWLDHLTGWAEVDSLCQSLFGPEDLLGDWPAWRALIGRLAKDTNINKRRASLVLLTRPARMSPDQRLRDLAFETIEVLKGERPIIITKAVSWLLRSLVQHHAGEVAGYLEEQGPTLPAIAVREARAKLTTGRKQPARAARTQARNTGVLARNLG